MYEPRPSWLRSCRAEMPLEWVAMSLMVVREKVEVGRSKRTQVRVNSVSAGRGEKRLWQKLMIG